jgi:hypothetical protein
MPTLLIFAPCERAIVSQEDNSPSLITIMSSMTMGVPPNTEVPPHTLAPVRWYIFTQWCVEAGELGKSYEQRLRTVLMDDEVPWESITPFTFDEIMHRIVVTVIGFPVSQEGILFVELSLREVGEENEFTIMASYPIKVIYDRTPAEEPDTQELDASGRLSP